MKSVSGIVLTLLLISMLTLAFNIPHPRAFGTGVNGCAVASGDEPCASTRIVFRQNFDNETAGSIPKNWTMVTCTSPRFGSFTVDKTIYYGKSGKSAKFFDNSTLGSPIPYRNFTEQKGIIVVMFAIRLTNNTGNNAGLEVRVDDGNLAGSNIIFGNDSTIRYRDHDGHLIRLRDSYLPNRWYRIKMIMNIPGNVYNIHIDDHLEVVNASFTGICTQIHRIIINGTSPNLQPIGYIDDIEVRRCIEIPEDFPTIQKGIDAANPGDIVFVKKRIYFENITITKKNVWLIGEDKNATVIDGRFIKTEGRKSNVISVICSNVTICGFTIKNAEASGVFINGWDNTITNNIITFSLGCGIYIVGSNSTVTNNIIESNDKCGIYVNGSNSTVTNNIIMSNLESGIQIVAGKENLVKKNIIKNNGVGLKCDEYTKDNVIYQNRFVCNSRQALDYGSNIWDDGYPYRPDKEKGGGNYWSDFVCVDIYSGMNQDEHGPCGSLLPDGICDAPYIIYVASKDRYPLFLIQNVVQKPAPSEVTYEIVVKVNATILKDVEVEEAKIHVSFDSKRETMPMKKVSGDLFTGNITRKPYCTQVRYNVSARAYCAVWLNSTNYPLTAPYHVQDTKAPTIGTIKVVPSPPNENQTISISVTVTEPTNASGVDKVFLSYNVSGSVWKTEMIRIGTTNDYKAVMPKQPGGKPLNFTIEAYDKAGNKAPPKSGSTAIQRLAELSLEYQTGATTKKCDDPCNIDFAVMSKDETKTNKDYKIWNRGNENLTWEIVVVKPNPWFTITPMNGTTRPNNSTSITITVKTKDSSDPWPSVGEFSIKANGTKPEWTIITRVTVRYLIIDDSWASSEAPNRCDVNSTQHYAFHANWAHNCSDAISGTITVKGVAGAINVNRTGWANFAYNSPNPIKEKAFSVEKVNFTYVYDGKVYYIKSFTQKARSLTTTWDRVKIILSIADDRIDVGSEADVSWGASVYESDNSIFEGYPLFNDTLSHDTVGKWYTTTSSIVDPKYHLTAFKSNTVSCIWDRIKIIGGGVSQPQTNIGQAETVWFIGAYEYDNELFKGTMGKLFLNVSENMHVIIINDPMNWISEKDIWESSGYSFNTPSTRTFKISGVYDKLYNLTKIKDSVGPLNISWGTPLGRLRVLEEFWPWALSVIMMLSVATVISFWISEKKRALVKT